MNVPDVVANGLTQCVWMLRTFLEMNSCIPLNHTHQSKFNGLINAQSSYKITISMNVPDVVANGLMQCVWMLRTCLQMNSCIPLKSHPPEQI